MDDHKTNIIEDPNSLGYLEIFESHGPLLCMKGLRHIVFPLEYPSFLYSLHVEPCEANSCSAFELGPVLHWHPYLRVE